MRGLKVACAMSWASVLAMMLSIENLDARLCCGLAVVFAVIGMVTGEYVSRYERWKRRRKKYMQ